MTIEEKVREIMLSEELSDSEKLDQLHALISLDAFKIDDLNQYDAGAAQAVERWLSNYWRNISIEAFKYLALLNGGGVITLLNFVLNSKKSVSGLPIILPTALFAAGLLLCGISMMSAYGTQYCVFNEAMERMQSGRHGVWLYIAAFTLFLSFIGFGLGCFFSLSLAQNWNRSAIDDPRPREHLSRQAWD
jgi:hypothetical protein